MPVKSFVAYYRVSTARQGRSGLGLEAQRHALAEYARDGVGRLVSEFIEVESGRRNDRPQLQRALAACRLHRATLVVAKLDRLSRNAAFLLTLRDSGVDFVAADLPGANRLTVGILAMVAEAEADAISSRTKAALAAARRRGVVLGGHPERLSSAARRRGAERSAETRARRAAQRAEDVNRALQEAGLQRASLREQAEGLNALGVPAPRGGVWVAAQVLRLRRQLGSVATA